MVSEELLKGLPLFAGLSKEELQRVASVSRELHYDREKVIFEEDTEAEDFYLVLEGRVALRFRLGIHPKSRELTIDVVEPGEIIGWSALVPPRRLTASGVCLDQVRLLAIDGKALRALLDDDPRLGYVVMGNLAEVIATRLRDMRLRLMQEISQTQELNGS